MRERLLAMRPLLLRVVGYPLFFVFWFLVFLYVTFPYDRLKEAIIAAVEAPRRGPSGGSTPSNMQMTIGDLGPTFLPGVRAKNVTLTFLPSHAGERATTMRMDSVTVHVGLFSLLANNLNADVDVEGVGGTVAAHVESAMGGRRPGLRELKLKLDNVRVGEIAPLVAMVGLPLFGTMDATVDLRVPEGQVERASGSVRFAVDDLRIGDGRAQYQIPRFGGVTVEQIRAGRLEGAVTIRDGVATIERVNARSNEFQLAMDGRVELRPNLSESVMNAGVRFQLTDAYRRKSEQAGRIMLVMDTVPDLQAARRPDGMIAFRCRGTFDRGLTCPPDARGGAGGAGGLPGLGGFGGRRGF
jgi:type II secretion system protein N